MPDVHSLIILLSFLGILIWGCCLRHHHNRVPVEKIDKRPALDRLLDTLDYHTALMEELLERLMRIEDSL